MIVSNDKGVFFMEKTGKKSNLKRYLPMLILAVIGAVGGYLYYRFVGCASGACAITSNPAVSTIYGGVLGLLIGYIITPGKKKKEDQANES
jgi:H+/Cl- antiporter ClcA